MAVRFPRWVRRTGLAVIGIVAVGVVVGRTLDLKDWLRSQVAVPHGVSGWLAALTMPMAHKERIQETSPVVIMIRHVFGAFLTLLLA